MEPRSAQSEERLLEAEWIASFDAALEAHGPERLRRLWARLQERAAGAGLELGGPGQTPYRNSIAREDQPRFPGDLELERRVRSLVRWNALAMVLRANRECPGIGGHLATFASAATLFEVAQNHFLRGADHAEGADQVYFQGHASPGVYARAFLEGRLSAEQLAGFRRELRPEGGLPSYPHPHLMPGFWEFPSVSMGLAPLCAVYQARFNRYLQARGLAEHTGRVWAFLGDGEMDEPESLAGLGLAAREKLDNLVFVVNCNLQRLDGPVRGSGKIIQELEGLFRGAGWHVIKVIWSGDWDPLLEADVDGHLQERMERACDGDYQRYSVIPGAQIREEFFGDDPALRALAEPLSDGALRRLRRGGHDPEKLYAAYDAALRERGRPSVVLAKTVKGYGLGESAEARNATHQQKALGEEALREFRSRFGVPVADREIESLPFQRPDAGSPELRYLREHREALGGWVPERRVRAEPLQAIPEEPFRELERRSAGRELASTMVLVRLLSRLLREPGIGERLVPIVPDEARTFGMDALFRQVGIYAPGGQRYRPVDEDTLLAYREAGDGQLLEEGITEAGAMGSFIAAGTAYATHGVGMLPFFFFYSMFGFQRVGDLIWAAGDARARGFLVGATAGRTTLNGEGLQHQDGHSPLSALGHPHVRAYDPATPYEIAAIVEEGLRRMAVEGVDELVYLTVQNEPLSLPGPPPDRDPEALRRDIVAGMHRVRRAPPSASGRRVSLLGSGALLAEALAAAELLEERFDVTAEVWSVSSYPQLLRDALDAERAMRLHPGEAVPRPFFARALGDADAIAAVSDYHPALASALGRFVPGALEVLGTDGFGRSESRPALRAFFEVDRRHVALAALRALVRRDLAAPEELERALELLEIEPDAPLPRDA